MSETICRTKIVATLGPASSDIVTIKALLEAGADVFRFNFSHGSHEEHARRFHNVREAALALGRPVGIMADLQGPKLRVGRFSEGKVLLKAGQQFRLDLDDASGDASRVCLPHAVIMKAARPGMKLLLDDGRLTLQVMDVGGDFLQTQVIVGGVLSDHKGVNVPDVILPIPALTDKDREDLRFALGLGVDFVALSFVQRPEDVEELRGLVGNQAWIVSKIEKPQALECLEEIIGVSDAIMVARGDLGVELPPERVPLEQKRMVRLCRKLGKPVIVATQMLESMVSAPVPTRAEASDVATAVFEGVDAVMLSAETAAGQYPVQAVTIMNRIAAQVEADTGWGALMAASRAKMEAHVEDAIAEAASHVAASIGAAAIVAFTSSGPTVLRVARERPFAPVLGVALSDETARRLTLVWGVQPFTGGYMPEETSTERVVQEAIVISGQSGYVTRKDHVVVVAGLPFGISGSTNTLRVVEIPG